MNRVYIWGTGRIADSLLENGINAVILGFVETNKTKEFFRDKKVYKCTEVPENYDAVIVATRYSREVFFEAKKLNLDMRLMIFLYPGAYVDPEREIEKVREILGKKNFERYVCSHGIVDKSFYGYDCDVYKKLNRRESFKIYEKNKRPVVEDKFASAGTIGSYFWQDLWAARLINCNQPKLHYDIGSRVDGFIAHILAMNIPVKMIDIRPFPGEVEGLEVILDDATELMQFENDSIESLSALCSLEHFGLGRYGDPIDPEACFKCFLNIQKKIKSGGHLYISVPIGKERIEFNAHRIFYAHTIIQCFDKMKLEEFSCTVNGRIERETNLEKYDNDTHYRGDRFGLFHFIKK